LLAGISQPLLDKGDSLRALNPRQPDQMVAYSEWVNGEIILPSYRGDIRERHNHPLNVQFSGNERQLAEYLSHYRWEPAKSLSWSNLLHLFSPSLMLGELPVLPQVHDGAFETITLVKPLVNGNRLVFRLWPTAYRLADDHNPIWIGNISEQQQTTLLGLLSFAETLADFAVPFELLQQDLSSLSPILRDHGRLILISNRLFRAGT
jgi:hypothetical protein